jgi:predicted O-methyltransferase YrrM
MSFSSADVVKTFTLYEQRMAEEHTRAAAMEPGEMFRRRDEFLLPVGPEVGWFLHSLILARRPARILELGTSYGYSTVFLADAARQVGGRLVTMELSDHKQAYARDMIAKAGLSAVVDFELGDAVALIKSDAGTFDFVLLDIWKELYVPCLHAVYPKLPNQAIIAADNMIEPAIVRADAQKYRAAVQQMPDLQSVLLPIGSGIELSIKWRSGSEPGP